jgi:hypothetical protein
MRHRLFLPGSGFEQVRTKPTMYRRLLRSVLAAAFSVAVALGALSGAGLMETESMPSDSGWGAQQVVSPDSGNGQVDLADSGWGSSAARAAGA